MVNLKVDLLPQKHLVERYFASLEPKGIHYDGLGLDYFLPDLIKEQSSALIPTKPFITIALGAAHATKQIPIAGIREICSQIDAPIVLLGGPKEKSLGDEISASFAHVVNTCGQFSLAESAFAVQKSRILVTPDTGMMHIGAALRKKMIVVWGNTIPQFGMYSFYPNGFNLATNYEVNGLNCRPCSKIGFKACPYGHFRCMLEQEYHRMAAEIEAVLGA